MKRKPLPRPHLRLPGETSYEIGYCKPPKHTWFKLWVSPATRGAGLRRSNRPALLSTTLSKRRSDCAEMEKSVV